MADAFVFGVVRAFTQGNTVVILGSPDHGELSLKSLANAIPGTPLASAGIRTVLVEGYSGHEPPPPSLVHAIKHLQQLNIAVIGMENNNTLRGQERVEAAMQAAAESTDDAAASAHIREVSAEVLNLRMLGANTDWARQASRATKNVVVCCGASHVPRFRAQNIAGLVETVGAHCVGFAVLQGNNLGADYTPENHNVGAFAPVTALSAYTGSF